MTDTYVWSQIRDDATDKFDGQTPGAQIEEDIRGVFEQHPRRVIGEIDRVATKLAAGKITSAWPILRLNVRELEQRPDVAVTDTSERDRAVLRAERWVRVAGVHFDRAAEVEDELFGHHGALRDFAGDDLLRRRMVELWQRERPRGEACEREAEERALKWVTDTAAVKERLLAERRAADELAQLGPQFDLARELGDTSEEEQ